MSPDEGSTGHPSVVVGGATCSGVGGSSMGDDTGWMTSEGGWLSPLVSVTEGAVSGEGCSPVLTGDFACFSHITNNVCNTLDNKGARD